MTPERLFRIRVDKWMRKNLRNTFVFSLQQISLSGDPDKILCVRGLFVALELKKKGGRATPLQEHRLSQIRTKGHGRAYVVDPDNWPQIQKILRRLDKGDFSRDQEEPKPH